MIPLWILIPSFATKYQTNINSDRIWLYTGLGYVWTLSIPASIYFLINALFMDGSWFELVYAFFVGQFIGKVANAFRKEAGF